VFLSLILTPLMCLCAVFMIVRDVCICYGSLLSVVCMIVVTMGVLHLMGTALGPIESLALAVIIGVSVDYLIHLAFAYKNSFMQSRYFKSRASVLARSDSIFSAAITTFAAVLPLLGARIVPLRQFGRIFTVVTVISFVYSYGFFNAFLMSMGALSTRATTIAQDDADIQSAHADRADDVGWEDVPEEEKRGYTGRRRNQIAPAPMGFGDDEMRVDRAMRMAGEARRAELNVLAQAQRMRNELAVEMSVLMQGSPMRPQRAAAPASEPGSPMRPQRAAAPASAPASEAGVPPSSPRRAPIKLDTTVQSSAQDDERNLDTTVHSTPKDDEREPDAPAAESARTGRKPLAPLAAASSAPASEAKKAEPIAPAAVSARTARMPLAPLAPLTGAASALASEAEEAEPIVPATVAARTERKPLAPLAAKSGGKE
jgi:putative flippase GtrA